MQTFLPLADFEPSLQTLNDKHLNGQRNEAYQIILALTEHQPTAKGDLWDGTSVEPKTFRYAVHTVARQWKGYEFSLLAYLDSVMIVGHSRGLFLTSDVVDRALACFVASHPTEVWEYTDMEDPPWMGDERLHASHRSNLLRKDPAHYGQFGWKEPHDLPYFYPHGLAGHPGPYHPSTTGALT